MIHEIYSALRTRIKSEIEQLATLKIQVDWYLNQYDLDREEDGVLITTPCVLIEFAPMKWDVQGANQIQTTVMQFTTHLVTESGHDDEKRVLTGDHYLLELAVFRALMGWRVQAHSLPGMSAVQGTEQDVVVCETITRIGQDTDHEVRRVLVSRTTWSTRVFDRRATREWQDLMVNFNVSAQLIKQLP